MPRSLAAMLLVMTWLVAPTFAEKWMSTDGLVAVTVPNADDFVCEDDSPDLFLVLWISRDDNLYFGVRKSECPPSTAFTRSVAEEEFAQDWEGTITASSRVIRNGREFWSITAETPGHGNTLEITELITRIGSNFYKAYVGVVQSESADRTAIDAFLNSFEITEDNPGAIPEPPPQAGAKSAPEPLAEREPVLAPHAEPESVTRADTFNPLEWIGTAGVLLAVGLMIWWLAGRGTGRT